MKKVLCFLILSLLAINCTACSNNVNNDSSISFTDNSQTTSAINKTVEETTLEPETTQSDVLSSLSEDELVQSIVSDFTIDGVKFTYKKCSDNLYLVNSDNGKIDIDIALLKLDNKISVDYINVILSTESTDDICYKALVRMLKSDIFGLSLQEQMDILVNYKTGKVSFENGTLSISEAQKDNIRVIDFNFK